MKNKRLIILISIFAFLILVVILCSTLFTVKTASVNWLTHLPEGHILINKDDEISKSVTFGGSIFLFDKEEAETTIEEKFPYINVVKIETKFPNKLVLHVADRQEMFALKANDNCYVILDGENKVLAKYNATQYEAVKLTSSAPILVEVKEQALSADDFTVGKIAQISRVSSVLHSTYNSLISLGYEEVYAKGVLNNIVLDLGYNATLTFNMNNRDLSIKFSKIYNNLDAKIVNGLAYYEKAVSENKTNGTIVIRELSSGDIEGEFVPN